MDAQDVEDRLAYRALVLDRLRNPAYRPDGKGALGRSLKEMGVPTLLSRVAKSRGLDVDGNGRMRCPDGYQNGGEFTDINLTNCGKQMVQGALRGAARLEANVSTMRESKRRESKLSAIKEQVASVLSPARFRVRQTDDLLDIDLSKPLDAQVRQIRRNKPDRKLFGYEYDPEEVEFLHPEGYGDDRYVRTLGMAVALDAVERLGGGTQLRRSELDKIDAETERTLVERMNGIAQELDEVLPGMEYEGRFLDVDPVTGVLYGRFTFGRDGGIDTDDPMDFVRASYVVPLEAVPDRAKRSRVEVTTKDGSYDLDGSPLQEEINRHLAMVEIFGLDHQFSLSDVDEQRRALSDKDERREALYESLRKAGFQSGTFDMDNFVFPPSREERRRDFIERFATLEDLQEEVGDMEDESLESRLRRAVNDLNDTRPGTAPNQYATEEARILSEEMRRRGILGEQWQAILPDFDAGDDDRERNAIQASLERIAQLLPAEWTNLGRKVQFAVGEDRGFNQEREGRPDLIMIPERFLDNPAALDSLVLHEYLHSVQRDNQRVREAEFAFWYRVTENDEFRQLGEGYDDHEITKADDFDEAYIGKVYQGNVRETEPREVLPVLMEMLHGGRYSFSGDNDALYWLLGLLASAKD